MADTPAAGWYTDPKNSDRIRLWDGERWTQSTQPHPGKQAAAPAPPAPPRPAAAATAPPAERTRLRPMTWVILAMNGLLLLWFVAGASTDSGKDCVGEFADACRAGGQAGKGIALVLIIFVAAALNLIMGVIWLVTRGSWKEKQQAKVSRQCPYCAELVHKSAVVCRHCGRDIGFSIPTRPEHATAGSRR